MADKRTTAQLQQARGLIQAKQYAQARKILKKLDDPTARKWLAQIDQVAPAEQSNTVYWWIGGGMIALAIGLFAYIGVTSLPQGVGTLFAGQPEVTEEVQTLQRVPVTDANATAVPGATGQMIMYEPPQSWFSQGASFRTCPTLSDDCKTDQVILTGEPILVLGELEGETWLDSRMWYYVEVEGEPGFIHSQFITVTSSRPTSTPAPGPAQWAAGPSNGGASGGSGSSGGGSSSQVVVCECGYNAYDCSDFGSKSDANACFQYCRSQGKEDVHNMDGDNDGDACERMR
jgi:uncharacterized membrane protein YgcG